MTAPGDLLSVFVAVAVALWTYVTAWFFISLAVKRNDVADVAWGLGFVVATAVALVAAPNRSITAWLIMTLVLLWGLRLSLHIGLRNLRKPEDFRYRAWRDSWRKWFYLRSYFQVFILQGILIFIIALPLMIIASSASGGLKPLVALASVLWLSGFVFEAVGDKQLRTFVRNPHNRGRVITTGLWKYSRHPNYFGEVTQWWALGIMALPYRYGLIGLVGPATITFLIIKVSGVAILEKKYATNSEYQAYKLRTNRLIPLPPRNITPR